MIVADGREADWSRVRIVQAEGDEKKYGNQDTDGSRSLRHHIQPARDIGAAVRRMLEQAAAQRWETEAGNVEAAGHEVVHKSLGLRPGYGELAEAAMALPVPPRAELRFKRSEEHTSELQSLMRISYAIFCLQKHTRIQVHLNSSIHKDK